MNIDFSKACLKCAESDGLVPAIIQDSITNQVLMLGYMNEAAYNLTKDSKKVTFFSRSKNRLWTKGESSGHFLLVEQILLDCDRDTLLIKAKPMGPTCHTGSKTCFQEETNKGFIYQLEATIDDRIKTNASESYTNRLFKRGINKVAQKVGEEAVELVIEAKDDNKALFINEAADLIYHFLLLLRAKDVGMDEVESELAQRGLE